MKRRGSITRVIGMDWQVGIGMLGHVTAGKGLARNIRHEYSRVVLYGVTALLFFANSFNLGADLGAMSKAAQLIVPELPFVVAIVGFTIISLGLQVFISYSRYARYLKYLSFSS